MQIVDQYVNLDQFQSLAASGAIASVSLEAIGPAFAVVAYLKNKSRATLRAVNANTVRQYRDPRRAMQQLREFGIMQAHLNFERWEPEQKVIS